MNATFFVIGIVVILVSIFLFKKFDKFIGVVAFFAGVAILLISLNNTVLMDQIYNRPLPQNRATAIPCMVGMIILASDLIIAFVVSVIRAMKALDTQ